MGRKDGWRIAHDAEGVAVRFLLRREFDAATGAAGPGRSGVSLSGGRAPDHKTLSEFLRRHRRAINDVFTQVVQMARRAGLGKLGQVAMDSTRVRANASRRSVVDWEQARREQWARDRRLVRSFQQKASQQDPEEDGGVSLSPEQPRALAEQPVPALPKKGRAQVSLTDPDSRFLRTAQGWELG